MSNLSFQDKLQRLAQLAIKVGLGLQAGQEVVLTSNLHALELTRLLVDEAYKAGASLVTTILSDDHMALSRFKHAQSGFDVAPAWLYQGMAQAYGSNAARLAVVCEDPNLLSACDKAKVGQAGKARAKAYKPASEMITNFSINWSLVPAAHPAWAAMMFPDQTPERAMELLWDAIFKAARVDQADPIAAWEQHNQALHQRQDALNQARFSALHFKSPNTDLVVGLADQHRWVGGSNSAKNGLVCNPNIPTEEVFTTPHKDRINGIVRSTKPLSHQGSLIDGIEMEFKDGKAIRASAKVGNDVLQDILKTDAGAVSLGEVALVPHSSPISLSGLLFYNTLFDENAASHIALGQCYSECFIGSEHFVEGTLEGLGGNTSNIHIDWMIGGADMSVDGIKSDGTVVPLMRSGDWV